MLDTSAREAISRIGARARSAGPSWMKPITALVIITARMTALFAHPPRKVVKAAATSRILDENVLGLLDEAFQRSLFFFPRELIWSVLFKPLPASDLVRSCEGGNIVRSTCVTCGLQKELRTGFKNVRGYTLPAHGKRALGQGPFFDRIQIGQLVTSCLPFRPCLPSRRAFRLVRVSPRVSPPP